MTSVYKILNELSENNSRNFKIDLLNKHKSNELLKRVAFLAYDPFTQFYVRKIPDYTAGKCFPDISLSEAMDELSKLSSREITGNRAINHLGWILQNCSVENAQVIERIIGKDLKCGASESTFNKVWPELIHDYPCMLCSAFDQKLVDKIKFPAIVQKKEDGMRFNAIVLNGAVTFRSRNGKEIQLLGSLEDEFIRLSLGRNVVYDGELLVANEDGTIADRQTGNGILNKANKGTITPELAKMVRAQIWDIIPYDAFLTGKFNARYSDRWDELSSVDLPTNPKINFVETAYVNTIEEAKELFNQYLSAGFEGIILKDLSAIWENKRSKKQVKFKGEEECDLKIVAIQEGVGKYTGKVGAYICESRDGIVKVDVGSGLKDHERIIDTSVIGKIIAIKYNTKIMNKQGEWSLFLPIVIEIREDKTIADSFEEIK